MTLTYDSSTIFNSLTVYDGGAAPAQVPPLAASVQIGFTSNPLSASVAWTDITQYVELVSTTMGRQHELQQVNPSTCTLTLSNQQGQFSPWNTSSPYYHSGTGLVPGHPIRVLASWSGTTYNIFYGYIKGFVPSYGLTKATMTLQCYDALALLNLNTMDADGYDTYPLANASHYWKFADPVGSQTAADSVGSITLTPNSGSYVFGGKGPGVTSTATTVEVTDTSGNTYFGGGTASVTASIAAIDGWAYLGGGTGFCTVLDGELGFNPLTLTLLYNGVYGYMAGSVQYTGATITGQWNYVALSNDGHTTTLYLNGASVAQAAGSVVAPGVNQLELAQPNGAEAAVARVGIYAHPLAASVVAQQYAIGTAGFLAQDSGARVSAVLGAAGVPSALQNIGTGNVMVQGASSSLATTTVMSYLNTVINTERGLLYQDGAGVIQYRNRHYVYENSTSNTSQATFGYATGQLHYFSTGLVPGEDDLDLWNNIPVQRQNGVIQTAIDSTSQASYGRRTLTGYTSLLFTNDNDSYDLATGLLYQYKQPAARVRSITMDSTIDSGANLPQMLGRNLLDRITINWRPLDGSGVDFTQQSLIEQITHTIEPQKWTTTFAVTPIGTETFWRWGISKWGTDVWGF